MAQRRLLLLSNSKLHGEDPYQWCGEHVQSFFGKYFMDQSFIAGAKEIDTLYKSSVSNILFIPYAVRDYDGYAKKVRSALEKLGLSVTSIHEKSDPVAAIKECKGIFIGGGNTFLLLKTLYENQLIEPIRDCVLNKGIPYMGASAGTNVATKSINTTNDMPICYPPSFDALKLVPFNINPHYVDPDPNSKHMGETREERIKEYHEEPICSAVLGLKEGSGLLVENVTATLFGLTSAKLFQKGQNPVVYEIGSDLSFLLNETCQ